MQVFVRVYTSAAAIKDSPSKLAYVWQSQGCDSFYFQRVGRKVRLSCHKVCDSVILHALVMVHKSFKQYQYAIWRPWAAYLTRHSKCYGQKLG